MNNSPSNIFYILPLSERYHQNCQAGLAYTDINGLTLFIEFLEVRKSTSQLGYQTLQTVLIHCKRVFNPFILNAARTSWMILEIFYLQKHLLGRTHRRNVYQKPHNISCSNILKTFTLFPSYFQKYENSRR